MKPPPRPRLPPPRAIALFLFAASGVFSAAAPSGSAPPGLDTLRPAHPRLLLTPAREAALRETARADPFLQTLLAHLRATADQALSEPVVEHRLVGPRLLAQSRACIAKVWTLSLAFRWFGDERHAARALRELRAAAAFPDWNPSHLLDTAELCAAFAIGYDWLHDYLPPGDRAFLRLALIEKGLLPGRAAYEKQVAARENNWNPVCNAGFLLAALAIAGDEPAPAREFLPLMRASLPRALAHYAPDGAWFEGPGYWQYGTTYLAILLDALDTALGGDAGLSDAPGLARTGEFFRQSVGPSLEMFNYADSGTEPGSCPALFWLARRHARPALADFERELLVRYFALLGQKRAGIDRNELKLGNLPTADLLYSSRFYALEIVWYPIFGYTAPAAAGGAAPVPSALFRGPTDVAFLRASPASPARFYIGLKGAGIPDNHAHLDAGSFVLDARGLRWAADLGPDNYDLPDYFSKNETGKRWTYFRLGSLSHNIVTINGQNQRAGCRAPVVAFTAAPARAHAVIDLTDAYRGQLAAARRGIALIDDRLVLIQDELTPLRAGGTARWALLTRAKVRLRGDTALLAQKGETLRLRLVAPAGAKWDATAATPPTPAENQNKNHTLLIVQVPLAGAAAAGVTAPVRIVVAITAAEDTGRPVEIVPLAAWENTGG